MACVVFALVVAYAWMGDDAFITLRTVDHFISGRGLVWNPGERVQAYTHPLWMFVVSAFFAVTREPFYSTVFASLVTVALTLVIFLRGSLRLRRDPRLEPPLGVALLCLLAMGVSRGFVDWSTSGLENPLTHLFIVSYVALLYAGASLRALVLVAVLAMLNRMDTALLFAPSLAWVLYRELVSVGDGVSGLSGAKARVSGAKLRRIAMDLAVASLPLLLWEAFSLFYYGALVPNTALAKLNHGIPRLELVQQGFVYLKRSVSYDPVAFGVIALALGYAAWRRAAHALALVAGVTAYCGYVVWVGGDFMCGRFFTAPFVVALVVLSRAELSGVKRRGPAVLGTLAIGLAIGLVALGALAENPTLSKTLDVKRTRRPEIVDGITDERQFFAAQLSLRSVWGRAEPKSSWRRRGEVLDPEPKPGAIRAVYEFGNIGIPGYYAPKAITMIDRFALADPLLARLPAMYRPVWRIGHFTRAVPEGYVDSQATGENHLRDPELATLWQDIELVTRGPLWSFDRLAAIARLNSGSARELVDFDRYRYHRARRWRLSQFEKNPEREFEAGLTGAFISLEPPADARLVSGRLSPGRYRVRFRSDGDVIARAELHVERGKSKKKKDKSRPRSFELEIPSAARRKGYDEIQLLPAKNGGFSLQSLELRE